MSNEQKLLTAEEIADAVFPSITVGGRTVRAITLGIAIKDYAHQQTTQLRQDLESLIHTYGILAGAVEHHKGEAERLKKDLEQVRAAAAAYKSVLQKLLAEIYFIQPNVNWRGPTGMAAVLDKITSDHNLKIATYEPTKSVGVRYVHPENKADK